MKILNKEKLDRQFVGQCTEAPTSMLGKLSARLECIRRVHQGRGRPLMDLERGIQHYNRNNRNVSYDKHRSFDRNKPYNDNNQNFKGMSNFRDNRNRGERRNQGLLINMDTHKGRNLHCQGFFHLFKFSYVNK